MRRGRTYVLVLAWWLLAGAGLAQTNRGIPPLPALKSPVDTFRELLNLSPAERTKSLADRTPAARARLLEKLREYQGLKPDEREVRLRATELRWWLLPLMRQPATNRLAGLSLVPSHLRSLVEERLGYWDLLPPDLQREQLDNEDVAQLFTRVQGLSAAQREQTLQGLSPERQQLLKAGLDRWTEMSLPEREQTSQRFNHYFELSAREQQRVLGTLSDTERQQMEQALQTYEKLPREQRIVCLRAFAKFASMDIAERQLFLKNAERWEKMSPAERQSWRTLVSRVPDFPPLPPGMGAMPPPLPPTGPKTVMPVTNGG